MTHSLLLAGFLCFKTQLRCFAVLDPAHYRQTARRGRCWPTFEKTAHRLISALLKTYMEIIFIQVKAIRMQKLS